MIQVKEFDRLEDLNKYLKENTIKYIEIKPYQFQDHWTNGEKWYPANEWTKWVLIYES
jgi:hypothetical protein